VTAYTLNKLEQSLSFKDRMTAFISMEGNGQWPNGDQMQTAHCITWSIKGKAIPVTGHEGP
jgi:hypothetical protein